ncbi:MAG: ECF-type sigma factor [Woeseiaceae bacterium]|jgi:RNA polymerase sigma factor (TIGR02999 family)|nr:ECF-type sigma factor [Woeseiaceae bacterium]
MAEASDVTQLLNRWTDGDDAALEQVTPLVYDELKRIANGVFARESNGHTLQPTALVHEAYAKLVDVDVTWQDRAHFYALAARMMRRLLVNHAKARNAGKRGGGALRVTLYEDAVGMHDADEDVIALDAALAELASFDERKARVLEAHYFGGLTQPETAAVLGISESTVRREERVAKAWLRKRLSETG